jgi:hypothetical protein
MSNLGFFVVNLVVSLRYFLWSILVLTHQSTLDKMSSSRETKKLLLAYRFHSLLP